MTGDACSQDAWSGAPDRPLLRGSEHLRSPWSAWVPRGSQKGLLGPRKGSLGSRTFWGPRALLQRQSQTTSPHSQPDPNRFDRDRLFSVVARGVPEDLVGLPEYLRRTSKYLTDSEYTGRPAARARAAVCCAETRLPLGVGPSQELRGEQGRSSSSPPARMTAGALLTERGQPAPSSTHPTGSQPASAALSRFSGQMDGCSRPSSMQPSPVSLSLSVTASLRSNTRTLHFIHLRAFFAPNLNICIVWGYLIRKRTCVPSRRFK